MSSRCADCSRAFDIGRIDAFECKVFDFLNVRRLGSLRLLPRLTRPMAVGSARFVTTGNEVQEGSAVQIASVSVSPVRIRTAWSMPYTKILPSPIFPVFADEMIVSMTLST